MKKIILISALIIMQKNAFSINLLEASQQKLISYTIVSKGTHYGKAIEWQITNLSKVQQEIEIPIGYTLDNSDSNHQDLILAEEMLAIIPARETKNMSANAFCITMHKGSPVEKKDVFKITGKASAQLLATLKIISQFKTQDYTGQQAIWSTLGDTDPNNVDGGDSAAVVTLRRAICNQRKIPMLPFERGKYTIAHTDTISELTIRNRGNMFVKKLKSGDIVELIVCSSTDSTIFKEKLIPIETDAIMSELKWKMEVNNLNPKKVYYMRIKVNGVVRKERKFDFFV